MKKFLLSVLLVLGLYSAPVNAQQAGSSLIVATCGTLPTGVVYAAGKYGIRTMDTTGKDCSGATFTGSVSATTAATSQSTLPTLSPSASSPIYESLGAGLYTQPVFGSATGGGTQVDATHGLPVNVVAGGGGALQVGATKSSGSTTGTTGSGSTTLPATSSSTQNVCEISVRANATAATNGNVTLSDGTTTKNYLLWVAPAASGVGIVEEIFNPCLPASATNVAWTLSIPAPGAGGVWSADITGFSK